MRAALGLLGSATASTFLGIGGLLILSSLFFLPSVAIVLWTIIVAPQAILLALISGVVPAFAVHLVARRRPHPRRALALAGSVGLLTPALVAALGWPLVSSYPRDGYGLGMFVCYPAAIAASITAVILIDASKPREQTGSQRAKE